MATDYKESTTPADDTEGLVLEALALGEPYVFVVCTIMDDGDLSLRVAVGGGVSETRTVRNILTKTLAALPQEG